MVLWVEFLLVFILCVVLAVSGFAFGRSSGARSRREAEAAVDEEMAGRLAASQAEVSDLRARLEVLEKLAVDPDERVAAEIEKLKRADARPGAPPSV
jgi:hypothetical protein